MNTLLVVLRKFSSGYLHYFFIMFALAYSQTSSAGCSFKGPKLSSTSDPLVLEETGYRLLANKSWFDSEKYPAGTLMGTEVVNFVGQSCQGVKELADRILVVVYEPPSGDKVVSLPSGLGYRIPASTPGVAIELEFFVEPSNFAPPLPNQFVLSQTQKTILSTGAITPARSGFKPFRVKISIVKTGEAFAEDNTPATKIDIPGGLGVFRYYAADDPSIVSASSNQLILPSLYLVSIGKYYGHAAAPSCNVNKFGDISLGDGPKVVTLDPVSDSAFGQMGPVETSSKSHKFIFNCSGTADLKPQVYFEASNPFSGADGVGMPNGRDDIGIQLLFNDVPVKFAGRSPLAWIPKPVTGAVTHVNYGELSPVGLYCINNAENICGNDMTGPNWVNAAYFNFNYDADSIVTFKYYQTTSKKPAAGTFSVPFTVTIEIQ